MKKIKTLICICFLLISDNVRSANIDEMSSSSNPYFRSVWVSQKDASFTIRLFFASDKIIIKQYAGLQEVEGSYWYKYIYDRVTGVQITHKSHEALSNNLRMSGETITIPNSEGEALKFTRLTINNYASIYNPTKRISFREYGPNAKIKEAFDRVLKLYKEDMDALVPYDEFQTEAERRELGNKARAMVNKVYSGVTIYGVPFSVQKNSYDIRRGKFVASPLEGVSFVETPDRYIVMDRDRAKRFKEEDARTNFYLIFNFDIISGRPKHKRIYISKSFQGGSSEYEFLK